MTDYARALTRALNVIASNFHGSDMPYTELVQRLADRKRELLASPLMVVMRDGD